MNKYLNGILGGEAVVAITLGAGSTEASQQVLEKMILDKNVQLTASRSFWLMQPNDETRMEESNVDVAVDMARHWGSEVGKELIRSNTAK